MKCLYFSNLNPPFHLQSQAYFVQLVGDLCCNKVEFSILQYFRGRDSLYISPYSQLSNLQCQSKNTVWTGLDTVLLHTIKKNPLLPSFFFLTTTLPLSTTTSLPKNYHAPSNCCTKHKHLCTKYCRESFSTLGSAKTAILQWASGAAKGWYVCERGKWQARLERVYNK